MAEADHPQLLMTRPFVAGPLAFFVAVPDDQTRATVEHLLADLASPADLAIEFECFVLSRNPDVAGAWDLSGPPELLLVGASLGEALSNLVTGVNLAALAAEPDRLHLHAAAVAIDGRAAIISAPRDTGKTTTVVGLLEQGCDYLTDEAVAIDPKNRSITAFAKPLSIKPHGRHLVVDVTAPPLPAEYGDGDVVHLVASELGADICQHAVPALVVVLTRQRSVDAEEPMVAELHPADAVVRLMGETMDAQRYGAAAVVDLAALASRSRCVVIDVGNVAATASMIRRLLTDPPPEAIATSVLQADGRVRPSVVTVRLGDRAVVHDTHSGVIVALDAAAVRIWLVAGGWQPDPAVDLDGPVIKPFIEQLVSLGLLHE